MNKEFDMPTFMIKTLIIIALIGFIVWKITFYLLPLVPIIIFWRLKRFLEIYSFVLLALGLLFCFDSICYKTKMVVIEHVIFKASLRIGFSENTLVKIIYHSLNNFDYQFKYLSKVLILAGVLLKIKPYLFFEKEINIKNLLFWVKRKKHDVYIGKSLNSKNKSFITNEEINHHIHVVGTSGYGKSVFLRNIIISKILNNETIIVLDLKGDFEDINLIFETAKNRNDFYFFTLSPDFFNYSCSYNIFKHGSEIELKDKILGSLQLDHYHFRKRVEAFLLSAIQVLLKVQEVKNIEFSLHDLRDILVNNSNGKKLISTLTISSIREELEAFLKDNDMLRDLSGLRADLDSVCKAGFGELLKPSEKMLDFEKIFNEGGVAYIHLDAQKFEESSIRIGKMILQDLKTIGSEMLSKKRSQRRPITIIIDEFSSLATTQFIGFLNKARASNIGIVIAHQELSDLTKFGEEIRDQIIGNTSTKFCFLQQVPKSAELIAGLAGTKTQIQETFKTETTGKFFKTKTRTGVSAERDSEAFLIHPNEIKNLKVGECFKISKYPENYVDKIKINYILAREVSKNEVLRLLKSRIKVSENKPEIKNINLNSKSLFEGEIWIKLLQKI